MRQLTRGRMRHRLQQQTTYESSSLCPPQNAFFISRQVRDPRYCPVGLLVCCLSASCLDLASGKGFGSDLVACAFVVIASAFCGPLGILPTAMSCETSFCFFFALACFAACFSSGVSFALAALAASFSAFSFAVSSFVTGFGVLSSANTATEATTNAAPITTANNLRVFIFVPSP